MCHIGRDKHRLEWHCLRGRETTGGATRPHQPKTGLIARNTFKQQFSTDALEEAFL